MASTIGSAASSHVPSHYIQTTNRQTLAQVAYSRTVSANKLTAGHARIDSYRTEPCGNFVLATQHVETYEQYMSGCREHEKCLGHFCTTSRGTILVPQRMATSLGTISNDYAKMAESVYNRDSYGQEIAYRNKLKNMMYGKRGRMRGDMPAGVVDSSIRGVLSVCWEVAMGEIAIPRRLAENMRVLRVPSMLVDTETGTVVGNGANTGSTQKVASAHYVEDRLREGDTVMVVRPPSLWSGNVQPMTVRLWEHECIGMSPSNTDQYHADHDGDEIQCYFIGTNSALEECARWSQLSSDKFDLTSVHRSLPAYIRKNLSTARENFMASTTLSFKELLEGEALPPLSNLARVKEAMANMFAQRLRDPDSVFAEFVPASTQGILDIIRQQLNQGPIGDMSRQAKLAASCIKYQGNGVFHICSASETIQSINTELEGLYTDTLYPLGGNPCVRAISAFCGVAQQASLDAHRVSQNVESSFDLVDNLIRGGSRSLVLLSPGTRVDAYWEYSTERGVYAIIEDQTVRSKALSILGAYSPGVLKAIKLLNMDVRHTCAVGVRIVCTYYSVKLTELEFWSLVELLCYRCELASDPITTKNGTINRDMRWMVSLFANHYGRLHDLQNRGKTRKFVRPETITDAAATCNFSYL